MAPHMHNHGTRRRWVVNFKPRQLSPRGKSPRHPLTKRRDERHSRSDVLQPKKKKKKKNSTIPVLSSPQPRHYYTLSYCSGKITNIYKA